ncbi:MAG: ArnT family glycosyltransferase [Planctomycetota bacterium]
MTADPVGPLAEGDGSVTAPTLTHDSPTVKLSRPPAGCGAALRKHGPAVLVALLLLIHFSALMAYFAPAIATPDANGYWAQGSLLFETGSTSFRPKSDVQYVGIHWLVTDSGDYYSRYPPGLAVLAGAVYRLFGHEASVLLNPLMGTLSLLGIFMLTRRAVGAWWALAAAFVLAVNPTFNQHAISCFAHVAVTVFLVWGLYFLLRWGQAGSLRDAFLAGLLLGCVPTVRYPEAVFGLAVGAFILLHCRERPRFWRHLLLAGAGAAVPILPLLVRNQLAFGAFYRTGYSLTNEQTGFGWDYFVDHFVPYVRGLHAEGLGAFFVLGLAGAAVMCCLPARRRLGVLLAGLAVPSALLYMAYYWARGQGGSSMRFLLPTFVAYILAGTWLLSHVLARSSVAVRASTLSVLLLFQFTWGFMQRGEEGRRLLHRKRVLVAATDALEKHVSPGDVVVSGGQALQHLDFVRKWRLADLRSLRPVGGRRGTARFGRERDPDAPSPMQVEKLDRRLEKYAGLSPQEQERKLAAELKKWAAEGKVYYLGTEEELAEMRGLFFNPQAFKVIAREKLPEAPPMPEARRRPGRRGAPPPRDPGAAGGPGGRARPAAPDGGKDAPRGGRRFPGRRGRRGGLRGNPFGDAKELVIAEWSYRPEGYPQGAGRPGERPSRGERFPGPREGAGPRPPAALAERVRKLRALLERMFRSGDRPDFFWPPDRDRELRRLMREGEFEEADKLLDRALEDHKRARNR